MAKSRREFLQSSLIAVVAAAVPIELTHNVFGQHSGAGKQTNYFQIPVQSQADPLIYLKQSSFEPYVNSIFRVHSNIVSTELTLAAVTAILPPKISKKDKLSLLAGDRFSLLFRSDASIPQDVYQISHAALGEFRLLIVPTISRDNSSNYYEAVINRSR
ncbi:MAG: hypothetical protein ABR555_01325 [Pyrinomonadaceae bacterium]